MEQSIKKIGVLTGGGDCPGLNAVIRAVAKTAMIKYGVEVVGFMDGFKGMVENQYMPLDMESTSGILHRGGTILGSSNRDNPFHFYVPNENGEDGTYYDYSDRAIENMQKLGVDALVVIGGDGSLHIANEFAEKGVKVVGVPKTIDNDLMATDVTFGFNTAVDTATEALDRLHTTAESHHRVMFLEVMGRYAGWIALQSGISGGADIILIPEIPFTIDKIMEKIREREARGRHFSIVVVAEGAKELGGDLVVHKIVKESHDPLRLGGIAEFVADKIEKLSKMETRVTVLGHVQRGGSPVPYDRILSTRYGVAAADAVMKGEFNKMVSLQGNKIVTVPILEAIKDLRNVDPNGEMVAAAKSIGICFGD